MLVAFVFLTDPLLFYRSLSHLLHILRGVIGITLLNAIPPLENVIEDFPVDRPMDLIFDYMKSRAEAYVHENTHQFTAYTIVSIFCGLIDTCMFSITIFNIAVKDDPVIVD